MSSLNRHEGYLLIDHKDSPGTKEVPAGVTAELKTHTCPHCARVIIRNPQRVRPRHVCWKCDRYTCDTPGCVMECVPWLRVAELILARPEDTNIKLNRTKDGGLMFNPALLDKTVVY